MHGLGKYPAGSGLPPRHSRQNHFAQAVFNAAVVHGTRIEPSLLPARQVVRGPVVVVMTVERAHYAHGPGQRIEDGEPVRMTRGRFMRHQDVGL